MKIPEVTARSVIASLDSPVKQTVDRELEALKAMLASGSVSSNAMVPMRSASGDVENLAHTITYAADALIEKKPRQLI